MLYIKENMRQSNDKKNNLLIDKVYSELEIIKNLTQQLDDKGFFEKYFNNPNKNYISILEEI